MDKRCCVFDMDGTLIDSMPFWRSLARNYLTRWGLHPDEKRLSAVQTMTMVEAARYLIDCFGIPTLPEQAAIEMNQLMEQHYRQDVPLKPGVLEYLSALRARGSRLCVATATARPLAQICLARLGVADKFEFILSCEEIGISKTQPDVFLLAAERLERQPSEIAVYEDSLYAARTAKKAGFYTVGVYEPTAAQDWPVLSALANERIADWRDAI